MTNLKGFKSPKKKHIDSLSDAFIPVDSQKEKIQVVYFDQIITGENPYPLSDMDELIDSIKQFGVEQNLVVKKVSDEKFLVVSGHRRYEAVKRILESDVDKSFDHLNELYCKVIEDEDEVITQLRLHETNFQTRSILKLPESDRISIVDDYLFWLEKARKERVLINGNPIRGKTKELLATQFNISESTAKKLISGVKEKRRGKTPELEKKISQSEKIFKSLDNLFLQLNALIDNLDDEEKNNFKELLENILKRL